jgi:hypothetical protein
LEVGLHSTKISGGSVHGRLSHSLLLLLILVKAISGQLAHLFRRKVGIVSLDLILDIGDRWNYTARQMIRLSHTRRRSRDSLTSAIGETRASHPACGLHCCQYGGISWIPIHASNVDIGRMRPLLTELLLVVKLLLRTWLLLGMLLLLTGLQ